VQGLDGEEPGHLLPVLVHVLQEKSVGPDTHPGVDTLGGKCPVVRVQLLERLLDALITKSYNLVIR
jgi:hypothetical protein